MYILGTVLSGVFVYIFGQWVLRWTIEPAQALRQTISQIAFALEQHKAAIANRNVTADDQLKEISNEFLRLSAQTFSNLSLAPRSRVAGLVFGLPTQEHMRAAQQTLTGLSNAVQKKDARIDEEIAKRRAKIFDLLGVEFPADERWPEDSIDQTSAAHVTTAKPALITRIRSVIDVCSA